MNNKQYIPFCLQQIKGKKGYANHSLNDNPPEKIYIIPPRGIPRESGMEREYPGRIFRRYTI